MCVKQGQADYALHSAGGRIVAHSAIYSQAPMPVAFRMGQFLAIKLPQIFPQPLLPYASKVRALAMMLLRPFLEALLQACFDEIACSKWQLHWMRVHKVPHSSGLIWISRGFKSDLDEIHLIHACLWQLYTSRTPSLVAFLRSR